MPIYNYTAHHNPGCALNFRPSIRSSIHDFIIIFSLQLGLITISSIPQLRLPLFFFTLLLLLCSLCIAQLIGNQQSPTISQLITARPSPFPANNNTLRSPIRRIRRSQKGPAGPPYQTPGFSQPWIHSKQLSSNSLTHNQWITCLLPLIKIHSTISQIYYSISLGSFSFPSTHPPTFFRLFTNPTLPSLFLTSCLFLHIQTLLLLLFIFNLLQFFRSKHNSHNSPKSTWLLEVHEGSTVRGRDAER